MKSLGQQTPKMKSPFFWVVSAAAVYLGHGLVDLSRHFDLSSSTTDEEAKKAPGHLAPDRSRGHSEASKSATGTLFHGESTREFPGPLEFGGDWESRRAGRTAPGARGAGATPCTPCTRWSVVTTIFEPSGAVERAARMPSWCMVIVADTKTPSDYAESAGLGDIDAVHFLSLEDQERWAVETGSRDIADFVAATPKAHFARKNIGYLYAIHHGAQFIYDFDDDNTLDRGVTPLANETHLEGARIVQLGPNVFNHHRLMGAEVETSWPRGFPLELIQSPAHGGSGAYRAESTPMDSVAVMQFCAWGDPDVDAVHRLVHPLPMSFAPPSGEGQSSLLVPPHAYVPYNAQATVHAGRALWALLLPHTVPGRVSDIWRGYFAQALFGDLGLQVAILPPHVLQERNEHNYLADLQSEQDLYFKAGESFCCSVVHNTTRHCSSPT